MRYALLPLLLLAPATARADIANSCHVVHVQLQPATDDLQIVAWVAKPDADPLKVGAYVGTAFITQQTGTFGLGNRPGRYDFNSGPTPPFKDQWPYGRRLGVFPVWAHANGMSFPEVEFQNMAEDDLSHPFNQSSPEKHFCRPQMEGEPGWDTGTCASPIYTDKGVFSNNMTGYPPRSDVARAAGLDSASVEMYKMLNPFDAVSQATPPAGSLADITWRTPTDLVPGDYVLWVEVSREFDFNGTYNETTYPAPTGISFQTYGKPYRGQPSVLYKVPFTISPTTDLQSALDYVGYGDIKGAKGDINPPDTTITTDTPGTGASRLQILAGTPMARVRVDSHPENDVTAPAAPASPMVSNVAQDQATVEFVAPGDDGLTGKVSGYEIRYRALSEITEDNFSASSVTDAAVVPGDPGTLQTATIKGLLPSTDYFVGVRAFDDCHNTGPLTVIKVTTLDRQSGEVDACFVATAAYGSILANEVEPLRRFRDVMLRSTVLGELAVETYYTFGPAVAGAIAPSDLLRLAARDVLGPIIGWTRSLEF
jgi:hypothetical protein